MVFDLLLRMGRAPCGAFEEASMRRLHGFVIGLAVAASASVPPHADEGKNKPPKPQPELGRDANAGEFAKRLLEKFDADKDGQLSPQERAKAEEQMLKELGDAAGPKFQEFLKKFDRDGDGRLNAQERSAAMAAAQKLRAAGGGAVGGLPAAGAAPAASQPTPKPAKPKRPSRAEVLKRFDKDGDGKLNDEEKAAAREAARERKKTDD
jgi:hypothetical protein